MAAQAIPEGHHTVTPYLVVRGAAKTIDFAKKAFGAQDLFEPMKRPDGTIMHAELTLDGGMMMLGSGRPGGHEPGISLIVKDADVVYQRAVAAGSEIVEAIADKPYGGRGFACRDLDGKIFYVGTYNPWAAN